MLPHLGGLSLNATTPTAGSNKRPATEPQNSKGDREALIDQMVPADLIALILTEVNKTPEEACNIVQRYSGAKKLGADVWSLIAVEMQIPDTKPPNMDWRNWIGSWCKVLSENFADRQQHTTSVRQMRWAAMWKPDMEIDFRDYSWYGANAVFCNVVNDDFADDLYWIIGNVDRNIPFLYSRKDRKMLMLTILLELMRLGNIPAMHRCSDALGFGGMATFYSFAQGVDVRWRNQTKVENDEDVYSEAFRGMPIAAGAAPGTESVRWLRNKGFSEWERVMNHAQSLEIAKAVAAMDDFLPDFDGDLPTTGNVDVLKFFDETIIPNAKRPPPRRRYWNDFTEYIENAAAVTWLFQASSFFKSESVHYERALSFKPLWTTKIVVNAQRFGKPASEAIAIVHEVVRLDWAGDGYYHKIPDSFDDSNWKWGDLPLELLPNEKATEDAYFPGDRFIAGKRAVYDSCLKGEVITSEHMSKIVSWWRDQTPLPADNPNRLVGVGLLFSIANGHPAITRTFLDLLNADDVSLTKTSYRATSAVARFEELVFYTIVAECPLLRKPRIMAENSEFFTDDRRLQGHDVYYTQEHYATPFDPVARANSIIESLGMLWSATKPPFASVNTERFLGIIFDHPAFWEYMYMNQWRKEGVDTFFTTLLKWLVKPPNYVRPGFLKRSYDKIVKNVKMNPNAGPYRHVRNRVEPPYMLNNGRNYEFSYPVYGAERQTKKVEKNLVMRWLACQFEADSMDDDDAGGDGGMCVISSRVVY